jgi:hypothetical protein
MPSNQPTSPINGGISTRNPTTNDDLGRAVQHEAVEISGAQQLLFHRAAAVGNLSLRAANRYRRAVNIAGELDGIVDPFGGFSKSPTEIVIGS